MKIWIGLVALALLAVTSCTSRTSDRPGPTLRPLKLAAEPTWTTGDPASRMTNVVVRDGLAVLTGTDQLMLIDVATGALRWDITSSDPLVGGNGATFVLPQHGKVYIVEHDGKPAVLIEYSVSACGPSDCTATGVDVAPEEGMMLLSVEDGSVLLKTPVFPLEPTAVRRSHGFYELQAVDDRIAVVSVSRLGLAYRQGADEELHAVAYDIHTGTKLWDQATGVWPFAVVDDVVLGTTGKKPPTSPAGWDELEDSAVVALDVATGVRKWDLSDRFARSEVVVAAGELALVRGVAKGEDKAEGVVVDTADGRELSRIGEGRLDDCATDGQVVACRVPNGLDVYDAGTDQLTRLDVRPGGVDAVVAGRIFLSDAKRSYTIDAAGNKIDKALPGAVRGITPGHAVFGPRADALDTEPIRCYALTS